MVADPADNDIFQYSNSTGTPGYSRTISSHVSKPLSLLFDASTNLYVANNTGNSVTQYNSGAYGFAATLLSSFTGPNHIALVP